MHLRHVHSWIRSTGTPAIAILDRGAPRLVSDPGIPTIILDGFIHELLTAEIIECAVLGASVELHGSLGDELSNVVTCLNRAGSQAVVRGAKRTPPTSVYSAGDMPHDRRGMFGLASDALPLPDLTKTEYERLDDALKTLIEREELSLDAFTEDGPGIHLQVTGCVACGVCAQSCLTGALQFTDIETSPSQRISTLKVNDAACDGGGECVTLCPHSALSYAGHVSFKERLEGGTPRPIVTMPTTQCERCRTFFPSRDGSTLCSTCRSKRENPFGVTWPEGVPKPPGFNF